MVKNFMLRWKSVCDYFFVCIVPISTDLQILFAAGSKVSVSCQHPLTSWKVVK